jgi:hypothetical protein
LPAVTWLTLAPKCKANVGPQPRSAVRTFVDPPLQPRSPRASWRPGLAPALVWPRKVDRPGVWHRSGRLTAGRGFAQLCPAENDVPGPAPDGPNCARSATTALDCQLAQVTRDGSCFRSTARCTRPKRRLCGAALGFRGPSRASLWAVQLGRKLAHIMHVGSVWFSWDPRNIPRSWRSR